MHLVLSAFVLVWIVVKDSNLTSDLNPTHTDHFIGKNESNQHNIQRTKYL